MLAKCVVVSVRKCACQHSVISDSPSAGASDERRPQGPPPPHEARGGERGGECGLPHPPELLSPGGLWHGLPVQQGLCPQRPGSKEYPGLR